MLGYYIKENWNWYCQHQKTTWFCKKKKVKYYLKKYYLKYYRNIKYYPKYYPEYYLKYYRKYYVKYYLKILPKWSWETTSRLPGSLGWVKIFKLVTASLYFYGIITEKKTNRGRRIWNFQGYLRIASQFSRSSLKTTWNFQRSSRKKHVEFPEVLVLGLITSEGCNTTLWSF